jgi:membrane protease YdiL (CAAX protease family)
MDIQNLEFAYHGFAYLSMFLVSWWAYKRKSLKFFSENGWSKNYKIQLILLTWGILVWACIPIFISGKTPITLLIFGVAPPTAIDLILVTGLAASAFLVSRSQAVKLDIHSPLFHPIPSPLVLSSYMAFRMMFLISYEIWFRGFLLQNLNLVFSTPVAIGINVFLYALIHIFASKKEALSSIGFGITLCLITLHVGAVWPAIVIHLSLSTGYEGSFIVRILKAEKNKMIRI